MEHTKRKFLLELENFMTNFPDYSIGEVLYAFIRNTTGKEDILFMTDKQVILKLEQTQFIETEN